MNKHILGGIVGFAIGYVGAAILLPIFENKIVYTIPEESENDIQKNPQKENLKNDSYKSVMESSGYISPDISPAEYLEQLKKSQKNTEKGTGQYHSSITAKEIKDEMEELDTMDQDVEEEFMNKKPYVAPEVIPSYHFGEEEHYDQQTLYFTADGYLVDSGYELITDIDACIGKNNLGKVDKWVDDALYIRNDNRETYYEVLTDLSNYEEERLKRPHVTNSIEEE